MKTRFTTNSGNFRAGLSLIEVLVSLAMTLVVLVAMMQAFKFANNEMTKGRASVELTNQLRSVEDLLRSDLRNLTVDVKSHYGAASEPKGYFEIVDGRATDVNFISSERASVISATDTNLSIENMVIGDYDDVVAATVRSPGALFRGRSQGTIQESLFAEVVWFTVTNDRDANAFIDASERVSLYRRVLIVNPLLGQILPAGGGTFASFNDAQVARNNFLKTNDVSVRVASGATAGTFIVIANSLESLAIRDNRFFAAINGQPTGNNFMARYANYRSSLGAPILANGSANPLSRMLIDQQDLLLNDVVAFDVRVFDPSEFVGSTAIGGRAPIALPSLNGIDLIAAALATPQNFSGETGFGPSNLGGAYVDLGKGTTSGTLGLSPAGLTFPSPPVSTSRNFVDVYYDTGTPAYDHNNLNDDGDTTGSPGVPIVDEGGDGQDNDGDGLIDESDEKEVPAPYTVALRGISVSVRMIEPQTNQVSQMTIKESLVAE